MARAARHSTVVLAGLGRLGGEHYKAMTALNWPPAALVGRSDAGCSRFEEQFGVKCLRGGLDSLSDVPSVDAAIVAVSHCELAPCTLQLLNRGCRYILLEKPGALGSAEMRELCTAAKDKGARVFVAYNRRFYDSVKRLKQEIDSDGTLLSTHFEFNEIEHSVLAENLGAAVLRRWGIVNSTHVIDLAFHLAGKPQDWTHYVSGALSWHPSGGIFVGSGRTDRNVMFSYCANWLSAGRWGLEFATGKRRFFLRPLEELKVQVKDRMQPTDLILGKQHGGIKEGVFGQMQAFKAVVEDGDVDPDLCTLEIALDHLCVYETMFGYEAR